MPASLTQILSPSTMEYLVGEIRAETIDCTASLGTGENISAPLITIVDNANGAAVYGITAGPSTSDGKTTTYTIWTGRLAAGHSYTLTLAVTGTNATTTRKLEFTRTLQVNRY